MRVILTVRYSPILPFYWKERYNAYWTYDGTIFTKTTTFWYVFATGKCIGFNTIIIENKTEVTIGALLWGGETQETKDQLYRQIANELQQRETSRRNGVQLPESIMLKNTISLTLWGPRPAATNILLGGHLKVRLRRNYTIYAQRFQAATNWQAILP